MAAASWSKNSYNFRTNMSADFLYSLIPTQTFKFRLNFNSVFSTKRNFSRKYCLFGQQITRITQRGRISKGAKKPDTVRSCCSSVANSFLAIPCNKWLNACRCLYRCVRMPSLRLEMTPSFVNALTFLSIRRPPVMHGDLD